LHDSQAAVLEEHAAVARRAVFVAAGILAFFGRSRGVVLLLVYLALRTSSFLARLLGQTGINVITRVLGVLLAALAVQYVGMGLPGLIQSPRA
jgi:small neutral amino acid transporter SnatA (MarC family)